DQVTLPADVIGDQAAYLQPEMKATLSVHEGTPVSIQLPQKPVLEVVDTEPTVKGQTASSSYKPAVLSNGVRTMVPTFVGPGTRIVVMTADAAYVEGAKEQGLPLPIIVCRYDERGPQPWHSRFAVGIARVASCG